MIGNYSEDRVHNEIELCIVSDMETKEKIEKELLKKGIPFYIRWENAGFFARLFSKAQEKGIFCVHTEHIAEAEELIRELEKTAAVHVEFVKRRVHKLFF